tara:strand:+ start:187 stop:801 length:615 start_codon:yes stop_codon:yes gene_type:complete
MKAPEHDGRREIAVPKMHVSRQRRSQLKGHRPCVIWLTGLSGAGKSTLANALDDELNRRGLHTYILDGDDLRSGLSSDLGFESGDREENVRRVGEVARLMLDAGLIVIAALISPYRESRSKLRHRFGEGEFFEIYLSTPLEVCEERDPKGLYRKARSGAIDDFTGVDSEYQPPISPDLLLDTSELPVSKAVERLVEILPVCSTH